MEESKSSTRTQSIAQKAQWKWLACALPRSIESVASHFCIVCCFQHCLYSVCVLTGVNAEWNRDKKYTKQLVCLILFCALFCSLNVIDASQLCEIKGNCSCNCNCKETLAFVNQTFLLYCLDFVVPLVVPFAECFLIFCGLSVNGIGQLIGCLTGWLCDPLINILKDEVALRVISIAIFCFCHSVRNFSCHSVEFGAVRFGSVQCRLFHLIYKYLQSQHSFRRLTDMLNPSQMLYFLPIYLL